jgi:DivIVA domain-containing protein
MRADEIDLREPDLRNLDGPTAGDVVPLDETDAGNFDTAIRGYNKDQVDDYLDRVERALTEADELHAADTRRFQAYEQQLQELQEQLGQAQQRAEGQPEPISLVGERLATMLRLAEEETAELRATAQAEADRIVGDARRTAEREHAERLAAVGEREQQIASAGEQADRTVQEAEATAVSTRETARRESDQVIARAQQAAAELTAQAERQAEALRHQADEDIRQLHDEARNDNDRKVEEARLAVRDLSRQKDAITQQLNGLRDQLAALMGPLQQA